MIQDDKLNSNEKPFGKSTELDSNLQRDICWISYWLCHHKARDTHFFQKDTKHLKQRRLAHQPGNSCPGDIYKLTVSTSRQRLKNSSELARVAEQDYVVHVCTMENDRKHTLGRTIHISGYREIGALLRGGKANQGRSQQ